MCSISGLKFSNLLCTKTDILKRQDCYICKKSERRDPGERFKKKKRINQTPNKFFFKRKEEEEDSVG